MMADVISYMEHLAKRNTGKKGNNGLREHIPAERQGPVPELDRLEDGKEENGTGKD